MFTEVYNGLVHDIPGLKPACFLMRYPSTIGATLVSILHIPYTCGIDDSSGIGLYGFSMVLIIDCLHNLGTLFSVKHLLGISSSHLCKVGPRLFAASQVHHLCQHLFRSWMLLFISCIILQRKSTPASLPLLHLYVVQGA